MSWDPEFEAFMPDTVGIEACLDVDSYGKRVFADPPAPTSVRCRIEQEARKVTDAQGKEVVSQTKLFLKPTAEDGTTYTIGPNDRITLPAGYVPQQPPILTVGRENDEQGIHHWEVAL